jgi:quercetin dioxygenase-like cupin family protein
VEPQQRTDSPTLTCDLAAEARELRAVETFSLHGHRAKTITRNGDLTIVLLALRAGAHIRDHRAEHPTTLITLRGRMKIGLTAQTVQLTAQQMLPLEQDTLYDMEAAEDSDLLLVVGRSTTPE